MRKYGMRRIVRKKVRFWNIVFFFVIKFYKIFEKRKRINFLRILGRRNYFVKYKRFLIGYLYLLIKKKIEI